MKADLQESYGVPPDRIEIKYLLLLDPPLDPQWLGRPGSAAPVWAVSSADAAPFGREVTA